LKKRLQESEQALQAYKEEFKSTSLDERQNTVVAELKDLSAKATDAKSARIKAESDYEQVSELGTNVEALLTIASIANEPTVMAARVSLTKAEEDFAALRQRYKAKHPKFIQARSQVGTIQEDLAGNVLKAGRKLKAALEGARAGEQALENARRTQETSALELSKLAIQYTVLTREVESDRALYDSVLNRLKETSVIKEMKPAGIRLVQPAYTPAKPFSPRKAMIMALSCMVGVFAGFVIVLGLSFLDTSIKTVDEAEVLLSLPVLSSVSQIKEVKKHNSPLVIAEDAKSTGAEAFRTLRTSLSMLGRVEDRRVFLFTSAMPQEGKTFCSLNYAASLAQMGLKTLLIDGDMRRPTVESSLLGRDSGAPGVTDYLTGQKTLAEVVQAAKLKGLFFIPGGTTAPNPAELLARDGLSGLIQEALQHYDRVVLDSAPIHAVSDTLLMLRSVQTVCLVVRAAHTSSRFVIRCVQLLQGAGAPLSGIILNRMPTRRVLGYGHCYSPYYDYRYHGKYSKKGVYGT
jgi:capsular exopolysaccharide synthesis family protein